MRTTGGEGCYGRAPSPCEGPPEVDKKHGRKRRWPRPVHTPHPPLAAVEEESAEDCPASLVDSSDDEEQSSNRIARVHGKAKVCTKPADEALCVAQVVNGCGGVSDSTSSGGRPELAQREADMTPQTTTASVWQPCLQGSDASKRFAEAQARQVPTQGRPRRHRARGNASTRAEPKKYDWNALKRCTSQTRSENN